MKAPSRSSFVPLLAACFLAAVVLAGMIFWSGQPGPLSSHPDGATHGTRKPPPVQTASRPAESPHLLQRKTEGPEVASSSTKPVASAVPSNPPGSTASTGAHSVATSGSFSRAKAEPPRTEQTLPHEPVQRAEDTARRVEHASTRPEPPPDRGHGARPMTLPAPPGSSSPPRTVSDAAPAAGVGRSGEDNGWKRPKEPPIREDRAGVSSTRERNEEKLKVALVPPAVLSPDPGRPTSPPQVGPRLTTPVARVAIVIDDFGLDLDMARKFAALSFPVTFSILPYLPHSHESAEIARSHNRQVMLHMPMEPQGYPKVKPGQGALLLSMNDQTVLKSLQDALQSTPHVVGINNHMGSRFTERAGPMKVVIEEIGHRGLFFLDSATSPLSVGSQLAQELRIPHARRDVFLDHIRSEAAVKAQLRQLIQKARLQGTAVAIGHPHEVTLRVLQGSAELLRREGIEVVPVGELMAWK